MASLPNGLDMAALAAMAPAFGIPLDQILFEKVRAFELACLDVWEGGKHCTEQKQKECRFKFGEKYLKWACDRCPENPKRGKGLDTKGAERSYEKA